MAKLNQIIAVEKSIKTSSPPAKRLPTDEWIALLHQAPAVAPHAGIPDEALGRESSNEDRA